MAAIAHRINSLFLPERRSSYAHSSQVDPRFQKDHRSLLVSRRTRARVPRAPCPSPDASDNTENSKSNESSLNPAGAEARAFNVDKTIAQLAELRSSELSWQASGFDGSASQYDATDPSFRGPSSPPGEGKDVPVGQTSIPVDDLKPARSTKQKGPREGPSARGGKKVPTASRMPFFNLQTVAPASSGTLQKDPKIEKLHIPGSYRSETETSTLHSVQRQSSSDGDESIVEDFRSVSTYGASKPDTEFRSLAVAALKKAKGDDVVEATADLNPRLVKQSSRATLMSTTSMQRGRHMLSKPAVGQSVAGEAAEPIVTPGVGQGLIYSEIQDTLALLQNQQSLESKKPRRESSGVASSADNDATSIMYHPASAESSHSKLSEAMEPSPPADKRPLAESDEESRTSEQAMIPQPLFSSNSLVHRRKSVAPTVIAKTSSADIRSATSNDVLSLGNADGGTAGPVFATTESAPRRSSMLESPIIQMTDKPLEGAPPVPQSHPLPLHDEGGELLESNGIKAHIRQLLTSASFNSLTHNRRNTNASVSRRSSQATNKTAFQVKEASGSKNRPKTPSPTSHVNISNEHPKGVQPQRSSEPFTRAIQELEGLLSDALVIAKQAADPIHNVINPTSTEHLTHHGRRHSHPRHAVDSSYGSSVSDESTSTSSPGADEEAQRTTLPSAFQSNGQFRNGPAAEPDLAPRSMRSLPQALNQPLLILPTKDQGGANKPSSHENAPKYHRRLPQEIGGAGDDGPAMTTGYAEHVIESAQAASPDMRTKSFDARDWALATQPSDRRLSTNQPVKLVPLPSAFTDQNIHDDKYSFPLNSDPPMLLGADLNQGPPIQPRTSSVSLRPPQSGELPYPTQISLGPTPAGVTRTKNLGPSEAESRKRPQPSAATRPVTRPRPLDERDYSFAPSIASTPEGKVPLSYPLETSREEQGSHAQDPLRREYSLTGRRHVSLRGASGFNFSRAHRRAPLARDWSPSRKRYVATVTCLNTALLGLIIGIYAGEVPAIQYAIVDENHYTILGNVVFFLGLAITTILAWPLPLLHGRKPYTLAAFALVLPLQFPQALAVGKSRSPDTAIYRVLLLVPRAFAGIVMGLANINFKTTLLDLFGASLQSSNPHQEVVVVNDVRRHGGGLGVWLGIWTWCSIGSIGVGFLIGAVIIGALDVVWGFWLSIILTASALVINVLVPEVRRSPYRRSMAEIQEGKDVSRRLARGEIKMHLDSTGPMWWGEELLAGQRLCLQMIKQPGFAVLAVYVAWIYGQIIMVIVLLGALISRYYRFRPQYVGLCVFSIPLGALLAIPFQKASLFSRSRKQGARTDSMTVKDRITWTSHLVRRAIFMFSLPFAGLAYTLASGGTHTHFMVPTVFAGLIGFLSNLAIAECFGLIMETYDTCDLQPGMMPNTTSTTTATTPGGRQQHQSRRAGPEKSLTNFSCFPRVTAAFAIVQTLAYLIAAGATGWGGVIERRLGAQTATAVVAGVLLVLTVLLIGVLWRFREVQIIPTQRFGTNVFAGTGAGGAGTGAGGAGAGGVGGAVAGVGAGAGGMKVDEWRPIIIGNPSGTTRRMSLLEFGRLSRWSEIRRWNRLGGW